MRAAKPMDILLVDDSPADVDLTREALRDARTLNRMFVARDGIEALAFLRHQGEHAESPRPDLILLDLNMPRMNGHEVLAQLKSDPELRRIPVVILTTSQAETDILGTYDKYANCYITKPVELDQFVEVARSIESFWLSLVQLPPR
jgi:two-component system, chemotaxis family, response regulator Rcp1